MMLRKNTLQTIERDVGINLRRGNVGVAEDSLYRSQVGSILDHMRRAGVAQHVRAGVTSRGYAGFAYQLPDALTGQAAAACANKEERQRFFIRNCFPTVIQVLLQYFLGWRAYRHDSFLVTFATHQDVSHV